MQDGVKGINMNLLVGMILEEKHSSINKSNYKAQDLLLVFID